MNKYCVFQCIYSAHRFLWHGAKTAKGTPGFCLLQKGRSSAVAGSPNYRYDKCINVHVSDRR